MSEPTTSPAGTPAKSHKSVNLSLASSVCAVRNCGGLPYPQHPPQDPDSRHETERPYNGEARCGQVDDGGEDDFAAPLQRAAGDGVGAPRCRMPHVHSVSSFS